MQARREVDYSKNVVNLGLVSFFTDLSTEMILGILPFFIVSELGASRAILGLIEGLGESIGYASRTLSGVLADRLGKRKMFVLIGYALSTISKPFFALSTTWTHALGVRLSDRLGKGIRTAPRDALLSDSVKGRIGRAFGIHRSFDQAGAIVGPLLAFVLIPLLGVRGIFWFSFIPAMIAVLILIFLVREITVVQREMGILSNFRDVLRGKFLLLLIIFTVFSLGAYNFSFILLKGMELGIATNLLPIVFAVINLSHTAIGYPSGLLSDRIGGERTLILGYAMFFLASLIGFASFTGLFTAFMLAGIFGLYAGISETAPRAIIPKYISSELRGTAYGVYYLFVGVAFLAANTVFGSLWNTLGAQTAFSYSLVASGLGMAGLVAFSLAYQN